MGEAKNKKNKAGAGAAPEKNKPTQVPPVKQRNHGGVAFPVAGKSDGLSVRAYYAAKAQAGWIVALAARFAGDVKALEQVAKDAAKLAVLSADELMKAYDMPEMPPMKFHGKNI